MNSSDTVSPDSNRTDQSHPISIYTLPSENEHNPGTLNSSGYEIDKYKDTEPILDEYQVEPSAGGFLRCSNISARHSIALWAFCGFFCLYAMRVNLSVAIVAMVSKLTTTRIKQDMMQNLF